MPGEEDELAEVVSQTGLVGIESLLRSVLASVVDGDADGFGELDAQADCFNFCEGESSAESGPVAVSNGLASDGGSESIEGPGGGSGSLCSSGLKSSVLAASLVEPDLDVTLPVLSEMHVGDHVVMLNHWR